MVLEGVHLVPGMVPVSLEGASIVHVVVEISDEEAHRMHFHVRDTATGGVRAMDKYLERIDDIRRIQTFLTGCAIDILMMRRFAPFAAKPRWRPYGDEHGQGDGYASRTRLPNTRVNKSKY